MVSALLGLLTASAMPGLERYGRDWLMRARGVLAPPDDIAIVAIDEKSIHRLGRFPWPRSLMADLVDKLAEARPRAIALDVLYTDPGNPEEDSALADAISRAGNVVVASQLIGHAGGTSTWLLPLPRIADAAAATGHVNVHAEAESVARELPLRSADDTGKVFYAMPVETLRIAERIPVSGIVDQHHSVLVGPHFIPVNVATPATVIEQRNVELVRAARMPIDYIGPAGSFGISTYSFVDVLNGSVPASNFSNRYVLIGATAASLGERFAAPFTHFTDVQANQHGALMPGVEVLANTLNTILRGRFYSEVPLWAAFLWIAAVAAITIGLLGAAQGGRESLKQLGVFLSVATGIVVVSYLVYRQLLIIPPLTGQFVSFASAGMLGLLRRSIATGAELDAAIQKMSQANEQLLPAISGDAAAEAIARVTRAESVAILRSCSRGKFRFVGTWGIPVTSYSGSPIPFEIVLKFFTRGEVREYALDDDDRLVFAFSPGVAPSAETLSAATGIARAQLRRAPEPKTKTTLISAESVEARARALGELNENMIERWRFVDLAMRSVGDGLLITAPDGRITFANRAAAESLSAAEETLIGRNLLDRLADLDPAIDRRETLTRLIVDRVPVEREIAIRNWKPQRYIVRLAPVVAQDSGLIGIVASLSDITRQQELQQTKNDVISLVSHEMRTPLTAIQGMSELLAGFDMPAERRRDLNLAINEEAKRLTRMITQYLDITRLESGATVLRRSAIRAEALIERTLLLLEPLAAARGMSLVRDFQTDTPVLLADPDLLSRAVENLVSNAIKYGAPNTPVVVATRAGRDELEIEIRDRGAGIAPADIERIFDKFYRVPRPENADVPGTGLGLSLVREIAELHGGKITVRSEPGAGSAFVLTLPV